MTLSTPFNTPSRRAATTASCSPALRLPQHLPDHSQHTAQPCMQRASNRCLLHTECARLASQLQPGRQQGQGGFPGRLPPLPEHGERHAAVAPPRLVLGSASRARAVSLPGRFPFSWSSSSSGACATMASTEGDNRSFGAPSWAQLQPALQGAMPHSSATRDTDGSYSSCSSVNQLLADIKPRCSPSHSSSLVWLYSSGCRCLARLLYSSVVVHFSGVGPWPSRAKQSLAPWAAADSPSHTIRMTSTTLGTPCGGNQLHRPIVVRKL